MEQARKKKNELMFKVFAPRDHQNPLLLCLPIETTVGEVAIKVKDHYGYEAGDYTLQNESDEVLDRNQTLQQAHIHCGDSLELVSTGGGVLIIPLDATIAILSNEIKNALSFCEKKGFEANYEIETLRLKIKIRQKSTSEIFYLIGEFENYPALPPKWYFSDEKWNLKNERIFYPKPTNSKFGSSIFHTNPVLCAPFNRLAYQQEGGPHNDWGGLANWKNVQGQMAKATTVADMIALIYRDFSITTGRM